MRSNPPFNELFTIVTIMLAQCGNSNMGFIASKYIS